MRAEIGIEADGVPFLSLSDISATEQTLIEHVRARLGIVIGGPDRGYRIQGWRFTVSGPAVRHVGDEPEIGKGHRLLPPGAVVTAFDHTTGAITYEVP